MNLQRFVFVTVFTIAALAVGGRAQAESKPWAWGWGPGHWEHLHDFQPYIEHPFQTQNTQWNNDPWTPATWAQQRGGDGKVVVDDFYKADILRRQYVYNGTAAVDVGPGFYQLGGRDQRRVAAMLDSAYGVTQNKLYGMFTLYDWNTGDPIGTYTRYGLQMK